MIPAVDYIRILPEVVLSIFGIIVMMVDPLLPEQSSKKPLGIVALCRHTCRAGRDRLPDWLLRRAPSTTWSALTPSACSSMWSC